MVEPVRSRTNLDPMLMLRVGCQGLRERLQDKPSNDGNDPFYVVTDSCGFMFLLARRFHSCLNSFHGVIFFLNRDNVALALAFARSAGRARVGHRAGT